MVAKLIFIHKYYFKTELPSPIRETWSAKSNVIPLSTWPPLPLNHTVPYLRPWLYNILVLGITTSFPFRSLGIWTVQVLPLSWPARSQILRCIDNCIEIIAIRLALNSHVFKPLQMSADGVRLLKWIPRSEAQPALATVGSILIWPQIEQKLKLSARKQPGLVRPKTEPKDNPLTDTCRFAVILSDHATEDSYLLLVVKPARTAKFFQNLTRVWCW